jgi:phospholipid transport system substrate-binding protein
MSNIMISIKQIGFSFLLFLLSVIVLYPVESHGQHTQSAIKKLLQERDKEIKNLVGPKGTEYTKERREKLKDIINGIVDYHAMAQHALQETYDTLSSEQRKEFVNLFSTIIRDQSLNNLDIYRANIKYQNINVTGDSATVQTLAQMEKVRTPVTYHMYYEDDNKGWVVTDIIIDDVSTAGSYRRQFQNIINKKGYDSLLKTLRKRAG